MTRNKTKPQTLDVITCTVGDTVDLPGPANFVRLPDGTVVTARSTYTMRHVGEHQVGEQYYDAVKAQD